MKDHITGKRDHTADMRQQACGQEKESWVKLGGGAKALIETPSTNGSCYCYDAWNTGGMACLL